MVRALETQRPVSISAGVAAFAGEATAAEMLVRADLAMYDAKAAGKDRVARYRGR